MIPEEDYETWKVVVTTVTDDIPSFGEVLPDLQRLVDSVVETNLLPSELSQYTDDFIEDVFPNVVNSMIDTTAPIINQIDNIDDAKIIYNFFRLVIKLCTSKISVNLIENEQKNDDLFQKFKKLSLCSIKMIDMINMIFDRNDLDVKINISNDVMNQTLIKYFEYDLKGISKCYLAIDNIKSFIDQQNTIKSPISNSNDLQGNKGDNFDELLSKESLRLSKIIKLIQKVSLKNLGSPDEPKQEISVEKEKILQYCESSKNIIIRSFPIFQKIAQCNLRNFDMSHLDLIFEILSKTYPVKFEIYTKIDHFPLVISIWDPIFANIISYFLKSQFFDKHLYILKKLAKLCTIINDTFQNNQILYKDPNPKSGLRFIFVEKESILNVIAENLEQIQNLHYNKEFNELIGTIYAFAIENGNSIVSIDHIKNFWSQIQFVFAADRTSFYRIFEKIIKIMDVPSCNELITFIIDHSASTQKDENSSNFLTISISFLDFLFSVAITLDSDKYRESIAKIQALFFTISFNDQKLIGIEDSKEETEIKEHAQKKLLFLCDRQSKDIFEKLVKEKLPSIQPDKKIDHEGQFVLKLLYSSYKSDFKMTDEECSKIAKICTSNFENETAINLLANILNERKITLEKDQIEKLSSASNKFLGSILYSSNFSDDDIENLLLSAKNVDNELFRLVQDYIFKRNKQWTKKKEYLDSLPFHKEDFLWKFALTKSKIQLNLIKLLCEIYSNNDNINLKDKQMINCFLDRIEKEIDNVENRESCFLLLKKFISRIDKTNPFLASIKNRDKYKDEFISVVFEGIDEKFYFSKKCLAVVIYYQASKLLNVPMDNIKLIYSASPLPITQKLSIFSNLRGDILFVPEIENNPFTELCNIRTVSPLTQICHSNLMTKLMKIMLENKQDSNDDFILINILNDLPTYEPIYAMLNHFNIMKEINFEKIFPANHPRFFLYSLKSLKSMNNNLKDDFIRAKGIEYFINVIPKINSLSLIDEIINYLALILNSNDLIEKYSNKLFEVLLRVCLCIPNFDNNNCFNLMKQLKLSNLPKIRPDFKIELTEPMKEGEKGEDSNFQDCALMDCFYDEQFLLSQMGIYENPEYLFRENRVADIKSRFSSSRKNDDNKDMKVNVDAEIPFSDLIALSIAVSFIKKNIQLSTNLELQTEKLTIMKKIVKEIYAKLPIAPEYFEFYFSYLNSSNYKGFLDIYSPHAKPITEACIQFIINNLDVKSKYLSFIIEFIYSKINEIIAIEEKDIIFNFIFNNFFILDRDSSISDDVFKIALEIASYAPYETIIKELNKIGVPEFDKYNICGKDFNASNGPTGLKNLGFTCYFNSILQQFYHCLSFRKALIEYKGSDPLYKELSELFKQMKNGSLKYVSPQNVVDKWTCWDGEKLNPKIQQDAAEFTIMMIDKLSPLIPNSMFNGKLLFKIEGINNDEGQFYSERNEPFSVLILPINESSTIEDCLKSFNNPSFFTNKNQYYADSLHKKIDAKQSDFIQELPDHLILQLKRFDYDYAAGIRKKINSRVSVSDEIDVSSICDFKDPDQKRNTKYKLSGIIQHMGSAMGGHYYSYVMDRTTKEWYKFNDTEVTLATIEEVIENSNGYDSNAYLLFYDKSDLNEVDDSKTDQETEDDLQNKIKMNNSYRFFINSAFANFLNLISKNSQLHEIAIKFILKVIPHEEYTIPDAYFESIKNRLEKDPEFALKEQEEITDFKFLILNKCDPTNYNINENILDPMFTNSVSQRLLNLAIETFDFAFNNLPNAFFFFRVLFSIIKAAMKQKEEYLKDEENNKDLIKAINESLDKIYNKISYLLKYGIKEYAMKVSNPNLRSVVQSINLSVIVRLFNIIEKMPDDYVEMLKDPEFLKLYYSSKNLSPSCMMKNYKRAREMKLFDVDTFLKSFFIKESYNINTEDLVESIIHVFGIEAFKFGRLLKFRLPDNTMTQEDFALMFPVVCKNENLKSFLFDNADYWLPNIFMHDARISDPSRMFLKEITKNDLMPKMDFFDMDSEDITLTKKCISKTIQCLFGCLKELKDLILKDDYSKSLSFATYRYKAILLLAFLKGTIKTYKFHFGNDVIDFSPLNEFGEFLLSTKHSHPFDPHIILLLKILKNQCSAKFLYDSIPEKNIMMSPINLKKVSSDGLQKYLKILAKIIKNGFNLSEEFYQKFFMLVIFNLQNLLSALSSTKLYDLITNLVKIICDKNKESFIHYLDSNFEFCIINGFLSCITGLKQLNIKRPFASFVHSKSFQNVIISTSSIYPSLVFDIINSNENFDDTIFDDISIVVQYLCNTGENEKSREIVWNYLINNTRKRIIECNEKDKPIFLKDLFSQFDNHYKYAHIDLIVDFQQKQKEIEFITNFVILFIPKENEFDPLILNRLVYLSKYSMNTLNGLFDLLVNNVPQLIKDLNFVSDVLSNEICGRNWPVVEKLCNFAFDGVDNDKLVSVLMNSRIVSRLIQDLSVLNFIYENGIIENRFRNEDEEQLSFVIVPFRLIMKYDCSVGKIVDDDERSQIVIESSSLLNKLKINGINCQTKEEIISLINQFIHYSNNNN